MATFKDALPPFSRESTVIDIAPDLILRSSDSVDFHSHKAFLVFLSPVFRDMFTFPPPADGLEEGVDMRDGIPVVQLSESSSTLRKLLLLCYSQVLTEAPPNNLDGLYLLYSAADKYQIPGLKNTILATISSFVEKEPYRVFAIACHLGLPDLARSAARETLKDVFFPMDHRYNAPEFELIPAAALMRLHDFRFKCRDAAASAVYKQYNGDLFEDLEDPNARDHPWWDTEGHDGSCGAITDDLGSWVPPQWFRKHMIAVQDIVESLPNGKSAAQAVLDRSKTLDISCERCSRESAEHLSDLAYILREEVDRSNEEKLRGYQFI